MSSARRFRPDVPAAHTCGLLANACERNTFVASFTETQLKQRERNWLFPRTTTPKQAHEQRLSEGKRTTQTPARPPVKAMARAKGIADSRPHSRQSAPYARARGPVHRTPIRAHSTALRLRTERNQRQNQKNGRERVHSDGEAIGQIVAPLSTQCMSAEAAYDLYIPPQTSSSMPHSSWPRRIRK
jgi:hypothetical protein